MRVFLDTNVIVSAMATRGLCAEVLRDVLVRHQLIISEGLLGEVKRVLLGKLGIPHDVVKDVLNLLRDGSILSIPVPSAEYSIPNSMDKALVSAALNAKADLFVTGDAELLALAECGPMAIISPRKFWERAREKPLGRKIV